MGTRTHCPYCAFQCGITVEGTSGSDAVVSGDAAFPVNRGRLCVKGFTAAATLGHVERLTQPLGRDAGGELAPISWDDAFDRIRDGFTATQAKHGRDAIGVFGSGALTNEKAYLLGKFARVALRTANIDYNGRFCMSSAAAAANRALGLDRGLPFPLADIADADVVMLVGSNPAETMPPMMPYFSALVERGGRLVVIDPRRSLTAEAATHHLAIMPGTDGVLAYGILHLLIQEGLIDRGYIAGRTEGFERTRALAASYWPARVERVTGVWEKTLLEVAQMIGFARRVIILTGRGPEQQAQGVSNALSYVNLALAIGAVGREGSGYGTLTGQGNGQGGREHGQKADQLPGYRSIVDPVARRHVASVWDVAEESLPGIGMHAAQLLSTLGTEGGARALFVMGSNPVVSAPNADVVCRGLEALDFLVVSDFFRSETATYADVVLPAAQWAEEEGTMTNLEGRVIRRRAAFAPPAGVKTDLEVLCALAERLGEGARFRYDGPEQVFEELRRATRGGPADYSGITYERIDREDGVFWPCPDEAHPGTPRLFGDSFPTPSGRARFHAHDPIGPAEEPNVEYPLFLNTGRVLAHYQSRTQTSRVAQLESMAPRAVAQIHPTTAGRYGLRQDGEVTLVTRRGRARFGVQITPGIRPDTVFVPFHWSGDQSANRMTNDVVDPVSRMPEFKVCAVRIEQTTTSGGIA